MILASSYGTWCALWLKGFEYNIVCSYIFYSFLLNEGKNSISPVIFIIDLASSVNRRFYFCISFFTRLYILKSFVASSYQIFCKFNYNTLSETQNGTKTKIFEKSD